MKRIHTICAIACSALMALMPPSFIPLQTAYGATSYTPVKELIVSQPADNTSTFSESISFLGAANPSYPVTINGDAVKVTPNGFFASYQPLVNGKNMFTIKNGANVKTITVIKKEENLWPYDKAPTYGVIDRNNITRTSDPKDTDKLVFPLSQGTVVRLIGESSDMYRLSDNTYVYKDVIKEIKEGARSNAVTRLTLAQNVNKNTTEIAFDMKLPMFYNVAADETKVVFTIYETSVLNTGLNLSGSIFDRMEAEQRGKDAVYTLYYTSKPSGFYTTVEGNRLNFGVKLKPKLMNGTLAGATVLVDAGHGGKENGALGPAGAKGPLEKDINIEIAKTVKEYLTAKGAKVIMIRTDDSTVGLTDRVNRIIEEKPDISVSVHCNSMPVTADYVQTKGFLTFYAFDFNLKAANLINSSVAGKMGFVSKPPRVGNLAMARITNCPGLILETSFVSNPEDYEWLIKSENQQAIGKAIGTSVEEYLQTVK